MMVRIQTEVFEPGQLQSQLSTAGDAGAVVTFTGHVRDSEGLYLEHYPGMTEAALQSLRDQAVERFALVDAQVVHRVGLLQTDEVIVWVGTCAPHRQDAFDGACFLMDHLKSQVPIWKKEGGQWLEPGQHELDKLEKWS